MFGIISNEVREDAAQFVEISNINLTLGNKYGKIVDNKY